MPLEWKTEARAELHDAADFYEGQRVGLGAEFLDEADAAVRQIIEHPLAWQTIDAETRRKRTSRFPYGIVYAVQGDQITILAVMHLHRDPDYWKDRAP